jgi:hypothetical protein
MEIYFVFLGLVVAVWLLLRFVKGRGNREYVEAVPGQDVPDLQGSESFIDLTCHGCTKVSTLHAGFAKQVKLAREKGATVLASKSKPVLLECVACRSLLCPACQVRADDTARCPRCASVLQVPYQEIPQDSKPDEFRIVEELRNFWITDVMNESQWQAKPFSTWDVRLILAARVWGVRNTVARMIHVLEKALHDGAGSIAARSIRMTLVSTSDVSDAQRDVCISYFMKVIAEEAPLLIYFFPEDAWDGFELALRQSNSDPETLRNYLQMPPFAVYLLGEAIPRVEADRFAIAWAKRIVAEGSSTAEEIAQHWHDLAAKVGPADRATFAQAASLKRIAPWLNWQAA